MSEYGRGRRESILTPGMLSHKQAVKASEHRRARLKQGRLERDGESDPSWTEDEDDYKRNDGSRPTHGPVDEVALDLMADERKRQDLIQKIRQRDNRDDHINMDEDELQAIWDAGNDKGKKKASTDVLFSKGSKVVDNGPARPAMPHTASSNSSKQPANSRKRRHSSSDNEALHKRPHHLDTRDKRAKHAVPNRSKLSLNSIPSRRKFECFAAHSPGSRKQTRSTTPPSHLRFNRSRDGHQSRSSSHLASSRTSTPTSSTQSSSRHDHNQAEAGRSEGNTSDPDTDLDSEEEHGPDMASRGHTVKKSKRGRSGEFRGVERELVDETVDLLCATLLARGFFPNPQQYVRWIARSWAKSIKTLKLSSQKYTMTKRHNQTIRDRVHSFRGRVRDRVKSVVAQRFEFRGQSLSTKAIERTVREALPYEFHRKPESATGKGWFQHAFVQRMICEAFFTGRSPLGIKFPQLFDPFPAKAVSLVCAMAMFLLGQWKTGKHIKQRMGIDALKPLYNKQQCVMSMFCDKQVRRANELFDKLYSQSMEDVGATIPVLDQDSLFGEDDIDDSMFAEDEPSGEDDPPHEDEPKDNHVTGSPLRVRRRETGSLSPHSSGIQTPTRLGEYLVSNGLETGRHDNTPRPVAGPSAPRFIATPAGGGAVANSGDVPVQSCVRSRIEVVLPAPASGLRKKGPSAAKSAGKLKVLSSQKEF